MCSRTNGGNGWANGFCETNRKSESTNGNTRSIGVLSESVAAAISMNRDITAAALTVSPTEPKMDFSGNQELLLNIDLQFQSKTRQNHHLLGAVSDHQFQWMNH